MLTELYFTELVIVLMNDFGQDRNTYIRKETPS